MNIKKIYLTRHGQTDLNLKGVVQGSGIDSSLNATGIRQASDFYDTYKDVPFDKVYVSALKRTHESMHGFLTEGMAHEALPELNEISWGVREGHAVDEEGDAYYNRMLESWRKGHTHVRIEGGENPEEVAVRMQKGLDYIMSQKQESTILICMHGRAMRIMLCLMLNYPLKGMDIFKHKNLCLYELTYTGSMFSVNKACDVKHINS